MARTIKKRVGKKRKSRGKRTRTKNNKVKRRSARKSHKSLGKKKRTLNKSQKGGDILTAAGIGLAVSAVGAAIYSGLRLLRRVNDKTIPMRLINSPAGIIRWLPKVQTVETNAYAKHYRECITEHEFFELIFPKKFHKSRTLMLAILNISKYDKDLKNKEFYERVNQFYRKNTDWGSQLKLNTKFLETTDNPHLTELKSLLLPTARYTGIINREEEVDDETDTNMIISSHNILQIQICSVFFLLDLSFENI